MNIESSMMIANIRDLLIVELVRFLLIIITKSPEYIFCAKIINWEEGLFMNNL
jgi:hypothetical protein